MDWTNIYQGPKLGFGLMRLPMLEDKKEFDMDQVCQMVDEFLAAGGKYFDTAFVYPGSEEAIGKALCQRHPRESYYLASKLNAQAWACGNEQEAKDELRISLERTGAGYFDFYLVHSITRASLPLYDLYGIWNYMKEAKDKGLVRHWGLSFHDEPELLDEVLKAHPEVEFVQLQINYADWDNKTIQSRACYEVAVKHGKPVVVMEPVKGGMLANPPGPVAALLQAANPDMSMASWAIRFVASLPEVMVVLSGMSKLEQMQDNLSYMRDFEPLSAEEQLTVQQAREALKRVDQIPCTSCHYCTKGCPAGIHIPEVFNVMNTYKLYGDLKMARADYSWRPGGAKASECLQCGQCEGACPQHLPIIELLEQVVETLEK